MFSSMPVIALSDLSELRFRADDLVGLAALSKHCKKIFDNLIRYLMCSKVASLRLPVFINNRSERSRPGAGDDRDLARTVAQAKLDLWDPLRSPISVHKVGMRLVSSLIVYTQTRCWSGIGEVIDGHPSQDLVVGPRVVVCPIVQLLIDPCQQTYRRVVQSVTCRLRFRCLDGAITYKQKCISQQLWSTYTHEFRTRTFAQEPLRSFESIACSLAVRSQCMLQRQDWVLRPCRRACADHVDVRSQAALRIS